VSVLDTADPAALQAAILGRRSVRRYLPRPVPRADLLAILEAARWAPSPHNTTPWRFALLTSPARKEHLAERMARRWTADLGRDGLPVAEVEAQVSRSRARLREAPALIVGCLYPGDLDSYPDPTRQSAERLMAAHSLGAALQTLMLTAHARGLATCWMCAPLFCPDVVVEALGLPSSLIPQALITVGYPAVQPPARERHPLQTLLVLDE
jgi:F420 biosynthesis protein FbiB-like protein